jgi:DNA repair protein RadD
MSFILRPYQDELVQRIFREFDSGERNVLTVLPTGGGKTVVFCAVTRDHNVGGTLIISHRREIVAQTCAKLDAIGMHYGVIQAGDDKKLRPLANVQVASVQTLHARAIRGESMALPRADLIIIDEAHHSPATTYQKVLDKYPNAKVLGFTATPCRGDGRGLGTIFSRIVEGPQVADLIDLGFLVKSIVFSKDVNLRGVETRAGDYARDQLERRMDTDALVGDVVTQWMKHAEGRTTICFASGVGHSRHITGEFLANGVAAEHLDGTTPKEEREALLARLAAGETKVVSNAMVLTEGWDCPSVGACILARPTKQMGLFRQMVGRALRPHEGKANAIILDHSGAVYRHGLPEDKVEWTLSPDDQAASPDHQKRQASSEMKLTECSQCGALRKGGLPCPACGFLPKRPAEYVCFSDEDLVEVGSTNHRPSRDEQRRFYAELKGLAQEKNRKAGYAFYKFIDKFGTKPPWDWKDSVPATIPSPQTRAWVRSRDIAWAKSRNNPASGAAA